MALNDNAVITAAQGFIFTAPVGTLAPTPAELDAIDPLTFGCLVKNYKATGAPTSYTLSVGAGTTTSLLAAATAPQVQAALEALATVGAGNVTVTGVSLIDTAGLEITWIEKLQGQSVALTATFTAGTSPALTSTTVTALNGWLATGHTSRDDMPEFGFDGGDTTVKGTWQRKRLREVASGDPVADFVKMKLEQFDKQALEMYYGEDAASTPGVFGVDGNFVPIERSVLVVIRDGSTNVGFYAIKGSIKRDDSIDLPVDDFAGLPIKITFLNLGVNRLYDWISLDLLS
jgi:hypothetical protein